MTVALLSPTKRPPAILSITHSDGAVLSGPTPKCEIGCLARLRHDPHLRHDTCDPQDIANARRRTIFYTRWYGLAEPLLQFWRG